MKLKRVVKPQKIEVRGIPYSEEELRAVFRPDTCHNPIKFLDKDCEACLFFNVCVYHRKGNYAARPRRETKSVFEANQEILAQIEAEEAAKTAKKTTKKTPKAEKPIPAPKPTPQKRGKKEVVPNSVVEQYGDIFDFDDF